MELNFIYNSSDHLRYENGIHVSGPHGGARRAIKVEPNISGDVGFTVTIYNLDGNHPLWQNNIQIAPKQMKIVEQNYNKVVLRGFGYDSMGGAYKDYGLTLQFTNEKVSKCIFHMHDRNVDIDYLPEETLPIYTLEVESLSKKANWQFLNSNITDGWELLDKIYMLIKNEPTQLKKIEDYSSLGLSLLFMLYQDFSKDIDKFKRIANICYFCISKGIEKDNFNLEVYKNRILMLRNGNELFRTTVIDALNLQNNSKPDFSARVEIYKMEISDIEFDSSF